MRLQKESEHRVMRWANGGGETLEIAAEPTPELWDWRVSLASVTEDCTFSELPGVDRTLVVGHGSGMDLYVDDEPKRLKRFERVDFAGESRVRAELLNGAVRDLNLMNRRHGDDRRTLSLELVDARACVDAEPSIVIVLEGVLVISTSGTTFPFAPEKVRAQRFDAVFFESGDTCSVIAATQAVIARIR